MHMYAYGEKIRLWMNSTVDVTYLVTYVYVFILCEYRYVVSNIVIIIIFYVIEYFQLSILLGYKILYYSY